MTVFGRGSGSGYAYDAALEEWRAWAEADPCERGAMVCNVRHDHRVSEERAEHFDRVMGRPRGGRAVRHALSDYHLRHVRHPTQLADGAREPPDFLDSRFNAANILEPNPDIPLGTVLDLSRLGAVFRWAGRERLDGFEEFPDNDSVPTGLNAWLTARLEPPEAREAWIQRILDVVDRSSIDQAPYHPTWCTLWSHLDPHLRNGADTWAGALGLPCGDAQGTDRGAVPHWLIVLKYTVRQAHRLCRPTILDVGWGAYHFPSPPKLPRVSGGVVMDVRPDPPQAVQLPEYIHAQIPFRISYWIAGGRLCQPTSGAAPANLCSLRSRHHGLLADRYGADDVNAWMSAPV